MTERPGRAATLRRGKVAPPAADRTALGYLSCRLGSSLAVRHAVRRGSKCPLSRRLEGAPAPTTGALSLPHASNSDHVCSGDVDPAGLRGDPRRPTDVPGLAAKATVRRRARSATVSRSNSTRVDGRRTVESRWPGGDVVTESYVGRGRWKTSPSYDSHCSTASATRQVGVSRTPQSLAVAHAGLHERQTCRASTNRLNDRVNSELLLLPRSPRP